jgi:hypothetical protein
MVMRYLSLVVLTATLLAGACVQEGIDQPAELPSVDEHYFRCRVQPVLAKSCAFMDCHGNDERPLQVYAEQRFRVNPSWLDYEDPLTSEELSANLQTVRGFVGTDLGPKALLSEKPLDARSGGLFHRGRDLYGTDDVFLSRDEEGYQTLRAFVDGATEAADCVPGSTP